ncbi:helix-turn-helix domain-containing protein [Nocardia rhamnosiphila]|nr:helix-turn-helix domain-containing protein [Nocardia rhamnosiphila]
MTTEPRLDASDLAELLAQGHNQSDIARMRGVSRQAVSKQLRRHGLITDRRRILEENFPFQVPARLAQTNQYRMLRDLAEFWVTRGARMSREKKSRLKSLHAIVGDGSHVIEFDPDLPPGPGVSGGGWAYRKRVVGDRNLIIRVNHHTLPLTDVAKEIYSLQLVEQIPESI